MDDQRTLIQSVLDNDEAAFRSLFDRLWRVAFTRAVKILRDSGLAENIAQECCHSLFERLKTLRHENLEGWVSTSARNAAISVIRRRERETSLENSFLQPTTRDIDAEHAMLLKQCLGQLPDQHRKAVLLSKYEGNSLSEIAQILGSNINTVGVWISRGLNKLRQCMSS
jgi:RNA polymerase sigma factor (sigma-70 family)